MVSRIRRTKDNVRDFEDNLLEGAVSNGLFEGTGGVLLAVSGGMDSMAMAAALQRLIASGRLHLHLVIGHINHGLRGAESDSDEAFVQAFGRRFEVPVVCRRADVRAAAAQRRLSIETAGRLLRIEMLTRLARTYGCGAVATAHHFDDHLETLIHRLMRGTAVRGLCGIRPAAFLSGVRFIRPMLSVRRSQIEAYCRAVGLEWREDASNRSYAFTRNRIRHRLMPELVRDFPDAVRRLAELSQACSAAQGRIEAAAAAMTPIQQTPGRIVFDRPALAQASPWVQAEVLARAVESLGGGLRDVGRRHLGEVSESVTEQRNVTVVWPGGIRVSVETDRIVLARDSGVCGDARPVEPVTLEIGKAAGFGGVRIETALIESSTSLSRQALSDKSPLTERLDADCIEGPLTLRRPKTGDQFWPIGLGRAKKVARFLLDAKLDRQARSRVVVLADSRKILWVAPVRLDDRVKVTDKTQRILEIRLTVL